MYEEDSLTLCEIGEIDMNLPVEPSGTQQGFVEHISTVGSREDDDTRVGPESIHLCEQCVERILALIVAAHRRVLRAGTAHGIDLIDEDDTGCFLLGLGKDITHTAGTYTDEHLYEVGTRHGEERHASLSCHGFGKQRLTCSRRTDEQGTLGYLSSELRIFLRVLQEVDDLLHLLLGAFLSGDILEGDAHLVSFLIELGFALADIEDATASSEACPTAHTAAEHPEKEEHKEKWSKVKEYAPDVGAMLIVVAITCELMFLLLCVEELLKLIH